MTDHQNSQPKLLELDTPNLVWRYRTTSR